MQVMMMKTAVTTLLLLAVDIAIVTMEWPLVSGEWQSSGVWMLRFYTQSSNVLAMLTCAVCAVSEIVCLVRRRAVPRWAQLARYVSACCLMVTMIVAACILVPMSPGETFRTFMLQGALLYTHTVCPLVMLAGCLIGGGRPLKARHALMALVPTLIYGVITLMMNAKRIYTGPYFFFRIDRQPWHETAMWMCAIVAGNFAIAWLLGKAQNLISGRIHGRLH